MASIACVVIIFAYVSSLLAAPSQDYHKLPDGLIERSDKQLDINTTSTPEELAFHRPQPTDPQEVQLSSYPSQHNNFNNVRRRHRKRKLINGAQRPSTRRSETSNPPRQDTYNNKDSEVAIILAKLNSGADGTPSSVRPYRLEAGGRELTPLHDQSHETLSDILHALKMQVSGRDKAKDLNRRIVANATHRGSLELEGQLAPPTARSKANYSVEDTQKVPQFISLENIAETHTEPTFESVIQSRSDALKTETASTLPSEYIDSNNKYKAKNEFYLGNDEIIPLKYETKSSAENKIALGYEPIAIEPAETIAGEEDGALLTDMLEFEPVHYTPTEDGSSGSCPNDNAPAKADSQCDECNEGDSQCSACKHKCEAYQQPDQDTMATLAPGTCPGLSTLAGLSCTAELQTAQKKDTEDDVIKEDVGLSVNRKSYKISIIFQ